MEISTPAPNAATHYAQPLRAEEPTKTKELERTATIMMFTCMIPVAGALMLMPTMVVTSILIAKGNVRHGLTCMLVALFAGTLVSAGTVLIVTLASVGMAVSQLPSMPR